MIDKTIRAVCVTLLALIGIALLGIAAFTIYLNPLVLIEIGAVIVVIGVIHLLIWGATR